MPLGKGFYGKNTDQSDNIDYCMFCWKDGKFTNPTLTLNAMLQSSVNYMTKSMGFDPMKARELSNAVIPKLKRWKK